MASSAPSSPFVPNLEQQRKRAKELLRAHRRGEAEAEARVVRFLRRADAAQRLRLTEAQTVVAREAGFASWLRLKRACELQDLGADARLQRLLDAAQDGDETTVRQLFASGLLVPEAEFVALVALADAERALPLLEGDAGLALAFAGTAWSPLYVCCSWQLGKNRPRDVENRARIALALLALGADANQEVKSPDAPGGYCSVLEQALERAPSAMLAAAFLERGAMLSPTGCEAGNRFPLTAAVRGGNLACVSVLLDAGPPSWQAREALEVAIELDRLDMVAVLLGYGAEPNHAGRWWGNRGSCLHSAILLRRDAAMLRLILQSGVDVGVRDSDGRTAYQVAFRTGHTGAHALLLERGASEGELDADDCLFAACFALDEAGARRLMAARNDGMERPPNKPNFTRTDHQLLTWAIRQGLDRAVPLLLECGVDPNVRDARGETPLHLAFGSRNAELVQLLRTHGAVDTVRNFRGQTPFELAAEPPVDSDERGLVFEQAVEAVVDGDIESLRRLLDEQPDLVYARSQRTHHATLLHYVAANGTEVQRVPANAVDVARLLLERGAEPDAECDMYGGGETPLGLLVSSVYPERAGLTGELVRVLVRAGAKVGGHEHSGDALGGAIQARSRLGVAALVDEGAPETALAAAALGHVDRLREGLRLRPELAEEALRVAAAFGQVEVLVALHGLGVNVDARADAASSREGVTALHQAAWFGERAAAVCLLGLGANPTQRDSAFNGTPAGWAQHSSSPDAADVARLLVEAERNWKAEAEPVP